MAKYCLTFTLFLEHQSTEITKQNNECLNKTKQTEDRVTLLSFVVYLFENVDVEKVADIFRSSVAPKILKRFFNLFVKYLICIECIDMV